jgi:NADPH:quinone reductase-like Zn-dependent oxidoreductase
VGEAVMERSMACTAYNGRYLMMGFASNKAVADEPFLVPRRVALGNFKLCGVLLNYGGDDMVQMLKTAMGWNVAPTSLGAQIMRDVVDLVRLGKVRPVVGHVVDFEDLPSLMDAMAARRTTGRAIVTV